MNTEPQIIGAKQAAALLKCDYKTVLAALKRGDIPGIRVGRIWRIWEAAC